MLIAGLSTSGVAARPTPFETTAIQQIVDDYAIRLSLGVTVNIVVIATNPLAVSVEAPNSRGGAFVLSFEEAFLQQLDEDELRAVIAHELGHVWIFTHHPYLQTERGANEIAMRLVGRESLEKVYDKVWARTGAKGDLARFLGSQ